MNFDYTYISVFGFLFFEPMVVLTNSLLFLLSLLFFKNIIKFRYAYAKQMAWFILCLGISSLFGAIGHTVHFQLGKAFFDVILFLMNAFSLFAVYFLFRASDTYYNPIKKESKWFVQGILVWIVFILFVSWVQADFILIKIHAGLVLLYTLFVHYRRYLQFKESGSRLLIFGVLVSFVPILVHSLHISIHDWFNHKDLAHLFMIVSLIIIYKGLRLNVANIKTDSGE